MDRIEQLKVSANSVEYRSPNADMKIEAGEDRVIKGYLCVWDVKDDYGTMFKRGVFAKSLATRGVDSSSKYKIPLCWQHDIKDPIASFSVLKEDDYGLYFETNPVDDVPNGNRALMQIRSGTINQFSFGFNYIFKDEAISYDKASDTVVVHDVHLWEGSVVTRGSNMETYALRSYEDYQQQILELREDTEAFIATIPRKDQYEMRQLLTRHASLAKMETQAEQLNAIRSAQPKSEQVIDIQKITDNLKLF